MVIFSIQAAGGFASPAVSTVSAAGFSDPPSVKAPSAILIDADTGEVIFEKDADAPREPASLTKIMTALLAIETLAPDDVLTMDNEVYRVGEKQLFLQVGERVTVDDLLYAALIDSANDAAVALAKAAAGSVKEFVTLMNERARSLGCAGTTFVNAHGLPAEGHISTARDLAAIAREAMKNERFRAYVSAPSYTIPATNAYAERPLVTTNLLLAGAGAEGAIRYEGATGVKTGHTETAGACLIASASRDGKSYIAAILGAAPETLDEYADAAALLDYGFNRTEEIVAFGGLAETGWQVAPEIEGLPPSIRVGVTEALTLELPKETAELWKAGDDAQNYEYAFSEGLAPPLKTGDIIGRVKALAGGETIAESDLIILEDVEAPKGFWESLGLDLKAEGFSFYLKLAAAVIAALVIILLIALIRHRYTRNPYVRRARYGRVTREIKRVRRIR